MPQQVSSALPPPLCLDLPTVCLWRGPQRLPLWPKTFAVLRMLVEHLGQLLSKATLLEAVWPGTVVGDGVLMVCIRALRHALGDDPGAPRFMETVHRQGYRWIGTLAVTHGSGPTAQALLPPPHISLRVAPTTLGAVRAVGREAEVGQLHRWLDTALTGVRQLVFVTGEAGLGKTTVIAAFLETLRSAEAVSTLHHGQELAECGNLPGRCRMLGGPWLHPGHPDRSEADGSRPQHIIERMISHKPRVPGRTADRELRDLGSLELHLPIGDNPEANALRMQRGQRLCKPCTRHYRPRKARLPMPPQARSLGHSAPGESLREIREDLGMRMIAPHIGSAQSGGNRGDHGGRQVVRKITVKTCRIVHKRWHAIR
jgi:DNA-binding winged helix-turn-helix (wHTH) protein